jgi:hypothetical protein
MTHKGKVSCIIYGICHMMWEGISTNISYQITFFQAYFVVYYIIITILQFSKLMAVYYSVLVLPWVTVCDNDAGTHKSTCDTHKLFKVHSSEHKQ